MGIMTIHAELNKKGDNNGSTPLKNQVKPL